jgi:beta-glucosidase/6-phospho-beta-glucosidase/beta-galactosidase
MGYGKLTFPLGLTPKKGEYFDYLGINYYTTHQCKGTLELHVDEGEHNDLGWVIDPRGFKVVLERFHKLFKKEILFCEYRQYTKSDKYSKISCKYVSHLHV